MKEKHRKRASSNRACVEVRRISGGKLENATDNRKSADTIHGANGSFTVVHTQLPVRKGR